VVGSAGGSGQGGESLERGSEVEGPWPLFGDAEPGRAGGPGGDVQQSVAQLLRFGGGEVAVQEQKLGPGEQVDAGQGEL
jgi:hypothetical protein